MMSVCVIQFVCGVVTEGFQVADPQAMDYAKQLKNKPIILTPKDRDFIHKSQAQQYNLKAEDKAFIEALKDKPLDAEGVDFAKKLNKEKTVQAIHATFSESKKRCVIRKEGEESVAPARNGVHLMIFMSFCIPPQVWQDLYKDWETYPFTFVVRGLPQNSFEALIQKIHAINCPVDVNPDLFDQYEIDKVPAFVFVQDDQYEGVLGNVSLSCVLDHFKEHGKGIGRRYGA